MTTQSEVDKENKERSLQECKNWMEKKPSSYFLYIKDFRSMGSKVVPECGEGKVSGIAITWMGDVLGSVGFGREYRDNFGGTRTSINVYGTNGVKYHGTYYSSNGNYARIKAFKNQK